MTHCLIIGAAGMLGDGLVQRLLREKIIGDRTVSELTLFDLNPPAERPSRTVQINREHGNICAAGVADRLIAARPDIIFHLAAVVSGEAERDFDKGYSVNLEGTRNVFEAIRRVHNADGYCPRLVFTSSLAVFGSPLPDIIEDDFVITPRSSYGIQKAMGELLLTDYSRRGFFDGIGIRLPTICIRPGAPNAAASGFFSSIIREPLAGKPAILPVEDTVRHWFASPRAAVGMIAHAATIDAVLLDERRNMTMPGICATVADLIEALRMVAGDDAVGLIERRRDAVVEAIISTWPRAFSPKRALNLGFRADTSLAAIVETYLEDHYAVSPQIS